VTSPAAPPTSAGTPAPPEESRLPLLLSTAAVLVGATLLFLIQPMFARMILPLLGGSPAVWNTSLVFYQLLLLAGYAYAHASRRLGVRSQALLHIGLVLVALISLPIAVPRGAAPPVEADPLPWLLLVLTTAIGLPFFVVSSTGPLIQRWFSATRHKDAGDPYFLYAASNLGSMVGLLAYPFVLEPRLRLADQSRVWTLGYGLLAVLLIASAILRMRAPAGPAPAVPAPGRAPARAGARGTSAAASAGAIRGSRRLRWVLLAFAPSSLMMAVTTHITTDVAAVPLLWVIPLAIYLLTFILVFSRRTWIPHTVAVRALPFLLLPLLLVIVGQPAQPLWPIVTFHMVVLFVAALVCHGELAKDRPPAEHLTEFYLWIAVGGALGGIFNAIVAPLAFRTVAEYPIALAVTCLLLPPRKELSKKPLPRILDVALPAIIAVIPWLIVRRLAAAAVFDNRPLEVLITAVLILPVLTFVGRPLRFGLGVAALMLANPAEIGRHLRMLDSERSFFGVHRVLLNAGGSYHDLFHGATLHGVQRVVPPLCREPLSYYGRSGPLGDVFRALRERKPRLQVAVAGLGAGATAAYADSGDRWTYYEIDPVVWRIATDPRLFCFLSASPVPQRVVLGDARRSIAASNDRYDVLILDAYSSDAIPVHLLTREAVRLYRSHLTPDGLLVFHVSNKFFDLPPVVAELAADGGLTCRVRENLVLGNDEMRSGQLPSIWAVVVRGPQDLGALGSDSLWKAPPTGRTALWTDDFSSLFSVLRHK